MSVRIFRTDQEINTETEAMLHNENYEIVENLMAQLKKNVSKVMQLEPSLYGGRGGKLLNLKE